jgi:acyl CoA:acetate/3-ketoacid CoA transferase beta subunit
VVVTTLTSRRTTGRVPYVTSPGRRVSVIATDLAVFERRDDRFVAVGMVEGAEEVVGDRLGWPLEVAADCVVLEPPRREELGALRGWDPQGLFLRG